MIIDAHFHIGNKPNRIENMEQDFISSRNTCQKFGIDFAVSSINPFLPDLICPISQKHFVSIYNENERLNIYCNDCKKNLDKKYTVFHDANCKFFDLSRTNKWLFPYWTETLTLNTLKYEIDYALDNYGDLIKGIKIHTGFSNMALDEIGNLPYTLPLLIHTGIFNNQSLQGMMRFISNYQGTVQLAHFGRFDIENLKILSKLDNVIIDTSPANYLYKNQKQKLFTFNFKSVDELYYRIIDLVGIDKVVFGSDFPIGNIAIELDTIKKLKLSYQEKEAILYLNYLNHIIQK